MLNLFRHFLLPHESNNYRARILHLDILSLILFALLAANLYVSYLAGDFSVTAASKNITAQELFDLTNKARKKYGLPELKYSEKLAQAATLKARHMLENNYWAHYAPDGTSPWEFILKVGYEYEYAGENLARNFLFSKDIVNAWMKSPSHRENILKKEYTEVGFAVEDGVLLGKPTTLVVQFFAKPLFAPADASRTKGASAQAAEEDNSFENQKLLAQRVAKTKEQSFNLSLISILFIAFVLLMDYFVALRLNIIRNTSHNLISFIFLATVILGVIIASNGAIL